SILTNRKVLVTGGVGAPNTAELYDPSTEAWTTTKSMNIELYEHRAVVLTNGEVLVAGGFGSGERKLVKAKLCSCNDNFARKLA
ncbi:unnamed protein product, partial [Didymodactylos carnosus]